MNRGIRELFCEVPRTYEAVNHVLTLGMDIVWRRRAARLAASGGGTRWLDMCSGTGETAAYLSRLANGRTVIVACDFCRPMLQRAARKPEGPRILFAVGEADAIPFADGTFDLVTMSFATRNLHSGRETLVRRLAEFHRVLRPGGRLVNLETSQPRSGWIRRLFHLYVSLTVRPLGTLLSGSSAGYAYLSHTIPRFYDPEAFASILGDAGFNKVACRPMLFGAVAVHEAWRESL